MNLNVFNKTREKGYKEYKKDFENIFQNAISILELNEDSCVSVIFVKDKKMHSINKEFRGIDRTTDVISFALSDNQDEGDYIPEELGDIFINVDAAKRQALEYDHSLRREICFLFTHGICHLSGFDHQTKEEEEEMISYQKKILDNIVSRKD